MRVTVFAHAPEALAARQDAMARRHAAHDRLMQHADFVRLCLACHALDPHAQPSPSLSAGPNLAGLAGRATLGSGLLANAPGNLERWLRRVYAVWAGYAAASGMLVVLAIIAMGGLT